MIVTAEDAMKLYWKLVSATVDVELLKIADNDPELLRQRELDQRRARMAFHSALIGRRYQ